jgi:DNA-binding response OmpR family regulator
MDALIGEAYLDLFEVVVGEIKINLLTQKVQYKGNLLRLEPLEYRILEYLTLRNGRPISATQLADDLSKLGEVIINRSVAVRMTHLRKKLGDEGTSYLPTNSAGHQGYVLRAPETAPR